MNKLSILLGVAVALSLSGCSSGTSTESLAHVIKEESPYFMQGNELLSCNVHRAIGGDGCSRKIELMVFASQRIVKKLEVALPSSEIATLVKETIDAMRPLADSGLETSCTAGIQSGSPEDELCNQARIKIAGTKKFALQDVWDSLDAWQPYF